MAVAVAQEATPTAFNGTQISLSGVGAASTLVLAYVGTNPITSISDNASIHYTWTEIQGVYTAGSGNNTQVWQGVGGGGGAVTATIVGGSGGLLMYELTGTNLTSPVDTSNTSTYTGTSFTTVTMTPSTTGELVFFALWSSSGVFGGAPSSPWVSDDSLAYLNATYQPGVASGTGYSTTWSSASGPWSGIGIVFKAAAPVSQPGLLLSLL